MYQIITPIQNSKPGKNRFLVLRVCSVVIFGKRRSLGKGNMGLKIGDDDIFLDLDGGYLYL